MKSIFKTAICFLLCISSHFCFAQMALVDKENGYLNWHYGDNLNSLKGGISSCRVNNIDDTEFFNCYTKFNDIYYQPINCFGFKSNGDFSFQFYKYKLWAFSVELNYLTFSQMSNIFLNMQNHYGKYSNTNEGKYANTNTYAWVGKKCCFDAIIRNDMNGNYFITLHWIDYEFVDKNENK